MSVFTDDNTTGMGSDDLEQLNQIYSKLVGDATLSDSDSGKLRQQILDVYGEVEEDEREDLDVDDFADTLRDELPEDLLSAIGEAQSETEVEPTGDEETTEG